MSGIELLGAILLHFLWQGAVVALIYAGMRRSVTRPQSRYLLACLAMALMIACPFATWTALRPGAPATNAASAVPGIEPTASGFHADLPGFFAMASPQVRSGWLTWIAAAWMAGVVVFSLRLLGGWIVAARLRRRVQSAPVQWQQAFEHLRARLGIARPVRLLVSQMARVPAVIGVLRPVVLVPAAALAGLPADQLEALLLHEFAHIRRYDPLVNALQSLVEALLFYHPAVWWISGQMRLEREICCDDAAIAITGDRETYARALAGIATAGHAPYRAALAASGGSLANRIARLLGVPRPEVHTHSATAMTAAAALLSIAAIAVLGQTARPKFEVASVKLAAVRDFDILRVRPGSLTAKAPVRELVQSAYHLQPFEIEGGPNWIASDANEIEGKAAGNADRAELLLMLQSLLEDRFQLQYHRQTKEQPVYALTAVRSGIKLPPPQDAGCVEENDALGALASPGRRMQPPGQAPTPAPRCGVADVALTRGGVLVHGAKVRMDDLARLLARILGRPVLDRSGFTAQFDVKLEFVPDETTPGLPPPPGGSFDTPGPSIFSAIQQQLRLRLESTRGPAEVVVIDHVERPPAN